MCVLVLCVAFPSVSRSHQLCLFFYSASVVCDGCLHVFCFVLFVVCVCYALCFMSVWVDALCLSSQIVSGYNETSIYNFLLFKTIKLAAGQREMAVHRLTVPCGRAEQSSVFPMLLSVSHVGGAAIE